MRVTLGIALMEEGRKRASSQYLHVGVRQHQVEPNHVGVGKLTGHGMHPICPVSDATGKR